MSNNIVHSTTYSYLNRLITKTIVKDNNNEQLSLIIHESDNCIYNQPIIIPKYIQQFFKQFSSNTHTIPYVCVSRNYLTNTLVNYYTYLMVQTSRRNKNILHRNTYLYPNCSGILRYCKVNSPVYYTPALQLIEEALESNWKSRTILRTILITPLDTLYKQWYNLHVNKVLR